MKTKTLTIGVAVIVAVFLSGCEIRGSAIAVYSPGVYVPAPPPLVQYVEKCDLWTPPSGSYWHCYYVPQVIYGDVVTSYGYYTGYPGRTPYGWGWERRGPRWYVVPLPNYHRRHR